MVALRVSQLNFISGGNEEKYSWLVRLRPWIEQGSEAIKLFINDVLEKYVTHVTIITS